MACLHLLRHPPLYRCPRYPRSSTSPSAYRTRSSTSVRPFLVSCTRLFPHLASKPHYLFSFVLLSDVFFSLTSARTTEKSEKCATNCSQSLASSTTPRHGSTTSRRGSQARGRTASWCRAPTAPTTRAAASNAVWPGARTRKVTPARYSQSIAQQRTARLMHASSDTDASPLAACSCSSGPPLAWLRTPQYCSSVWVPRSHWGRACQGTRRTLTSTCSTPPCAPVRVRCAALSVRKLSNAPRLCSSGRWPADLTGCVAALQRTTRPPTACASLTYCSRSWAASTSCLSCRRAPTPTHALV